MKRNLLSLVFGLYLFSLTGSLSAQNDLSSTNPTFFPTSTKGNSGLQAVHYFMNWRGHVFGPFNRYQNSRLFWNMVNYGPFGGYANTATGVSALFANTTGQYNTADGYNALISNTSGGSNTAIGSISMYFNTTGQGNTALGAQSLYENTNGASNTGIGFATLNNNTAGTGNTGIGSHALSDNQTGNYLTSVGNNALTTSYSESYSVAVGYNALFNSNSSTGYNTAVGPYAIYSNTSGYYNAVNGALAMYVNTTGSYNTASGAGALYSNTTGSNNVAVGEFSMSSNTTGSNNTVLGISANLSSGALNNATALGANAQVGASNKVVIGSTSVTSIGGYAGWSNFSDGRYKSNIQQNVPGLTFINKLSPVTYTLDINSIENKLHENQKPIADKNLGQSTSYENDPIVKQSMEEKSMIVYSGFIAQDVEKAADSIGYNFSGVDKPKDANQSFYGLRYGDFVVPLVKAVQELSKSTNKKDSMLNSMQGKIDSLQSQINELRSMLLAKISFTSSNMPGASLEQNVPNPSTNSTTIGYTLPLGVASAQMQITDMNGKILQIISLSGVGRNVVTLDTSSFASGAYNYSLLIDGQLAGTKKMVSMR
jgi:trimeric autotransporter adhesin